ncbi:MAG: TatD family hydrolase [Patescibacteria group bacterium]
MTFLDAHTHIHFPAYDDDRENVFARAKKAGVKMITVGTQYTSSESAVNYAKTHKGDVWATVGFHPAHFSENWYHDKNEQAEKERERLDVDALRKLAGEPEVVALGECGLDYFRLQSRTNADRTLTDADKKTVEKQQEGFSAQIELAHEVKKPLMIHCRAAFPDLIELLHTTHYLLPTAPGIIHFFSGRKDEAKKLLDLGFAFTFGGVITFARDYDEVIKMLPLEAILSETDAPYVAPVPYRGKRNEPAYVTEVVKKLAELKNVSVEKMAEAIARNAKNVFGVEV